MVNEYLILGNRGHAKSMADAIYSKEPKAKVTKLFFPSSSVTEMTEFLTSACSNLPSYVKVVLGVGDINVRKNLINQLLTFLSPECFMSIIHKTAFVSESAKVQNGCAVLANAYIGPGANLGSFSLVNTNSVVEHDVSIGEQSILSLSVTVAGGTSIGDSCFLGMGASIRDGITIGKNCIVGANSYVHGSFPDNSFLLGTPAQIVSK
jgi:sugar O-acyltransferase (sialic acid O-acetyltransferase NeuD family)